MAREKVDWRLFILTSLLIGLVVFIVVVFIIGIRDSERKEESMKLLCKENGMYYETFKGSVRMCCNVLDNNGVHCFHIDKIGAEYYLIKFSKT